MYTCVGAIIIKRLFFDIMNTISYLSEVLQGVLVHGIHLGKRGDHEIHDGASRGDRTVLLAGSSDLLFCLLGFDQPVGDDT